MLNYKPNEIIIKRSKIILGFSFLFFGGSMLQPLFDIGKEIGQALAQWF